MITSDVGTEVRTTVNEAVPPASVVTRPLGGGDDDPRHVVIGVG